MTAPDGLTRRVRPDSLDGGWVASCPELPGCFAQGESAGEALENLEDAIAGVLALRAARTPGTGQRQAAEPLR
jgi:predicted RNase H-like HicB family nuclease